MKRILGSDHVDKITSAVITGGGTGGEATALQTSDERELTRNWKIPSRLAYRRHDVTIMVQKRTGAAL